MFDEIKQPETKPTPLMVNNQAAISVPKHFARTKRRKFIDIKHHQIQDQTKKGNITIKYIPTADIAADLFPKITEPQRYNHLSKLLQLTPPQSLSVNPGTV